MLRCDSLSFPPVFFPCAPSAIPTVQSWIAFVPLPHLVDALQEGGSDDLEDALLSSKNKSPFQRATVDEPASVPLFNRSLPPAAQATLPHGTLVCPFAPPLRLLHASVACCPGLRQLCSDLTSETRLPAVSAVISGRFIMLTSNWWLGSCAATD